MNFDEEAIRMLQVMKQEKTSQHQEWDLIDSDYGPILLRSHRIYVPDDLELKRKILRNYHDSPTAGHPGQQGTLLRLQHDYYWPGMTKFVTQYVKGCAQCQQYKINRRPPKPPMFPIESSKEVRPFSQCAMDFITDLPESEGYDSILAIIDHGLTKGVIFTPCRKNITAEQTADILFEKLLTKYGRPNKIISNRGPQFAAKAFRNALHLMGIESALSTVFHPQTDGSTERTNQEIEAYLSIFCTLNPEKWKQYLPLAEFTHNSRTHADRKQSPFELLYGYVPPSIPTAIPESEFPATEERLHHMKLAKEEAIAAHELSRARMLERFNKDFVPFKEGQEVWLNCKNLKLPYQSKKMQPRREGPFKIKKVLGPVTYQLELPPRWKIHDVFHVTLLSPFKQTEIHGPGYPKPPPDIIEGEEEYEVETILSSRKRGRQMEYLVRWKGYGSDSDEWIPEANLEHSPELLMEYRVSRRKENNKTKRRKKAI
jgi:hypothetical protein